MQLEPWKRIDSPVEAIPGVIGTVGFSSSNPPSKTSKSSNSMGKGRSWSERGNKATTFPLPHWLSVSSKGHRDSNAFHLNIYVVLVLLNAGDSQKWPGNQFSAMKTATYPEQNLRWSQLSECPQRHCAANLFSPTPGEDLTRRNPVLRIKIAGMNTCSSLQMCEQT